MDEITTFAGVLTALGGPGVIAEKLGLKEVTVRQWRFRGRIPPEYWPEIVALATERGRDDINDAMLSGFTAAKAGRESRATS